MTRLVLLLGVIQCDPGVDPEGLAWLVACVRQQH